MAAARLKGRIGYWGTVTAQQDLVFQYNPSTIQFGRRATYSTNQAAFADFPNSPASAVPAISWIRNEAEDISIELIFDHIDRTDNRPSFDVELALRRLDDFMTPDVNTGKPRDLFFSFGAGRSDRIRILEKNVTSKIYDEKLACTQATVQLKLKALTSRVRT